MKNHGIARAKDIEHFCDASSDQTMRNGFFGRLFPNLPALYTEPSVLHFLGAKEGPMDDGGCPNRTKTVAVGQVFFGQFVDHDITLDTTSRFNRVNTPGDIPNIRTPTLDLDCIYGDGPEGTPFFYVQQDPFRGIKLLTGVDGTAAEDQPKPLRKQDLPRSSAGTAIIGDPRNDENRIISQMQLAMIRFHNAVVDHLKDEYQGEELFEEARDLVTRHYHWAILNDFLPAMCGKDIVWDILSNGRRYYCANEANPFIPVEFSVAGYRFAHSMVPQNIQVQKGASAFALFGEKFGPGFSPLLTDDAIVDFHELFETAEGRQVQKAERLDPRLATTLLALPFVDGTPEEKSLATRNLMRGQSFLLPSGENVAELFEVPANEIDKVSSTANDLSGDKLNGKTPLWFYLLTEADVIGRSDAGKTSPGEGLGPVGARIVAEVMIGLMELDSHSFIASDRSWTPALGLGDCVTTVGDMLTYAQP